MKSLILFLLTICLITTGCVSASIDPTPTPSETPRPTATLTLQPTEPPTTTPEPKSGCQYDADFFARLKAALPVSEVVISHNIINDIHTLGIWYVEPVIQLDISTQDEISENLTMAINNALVTAAQLKRADPCVSSFDEINPIVVDSLYNGWFSGTIQPEDIPDTPYDGVMEDMFAVTEIGYFRENFPAPIGKAPPKSCDWPTTLGKIRQHFSPKLVNTEFYFVRDELGNNVWANFYVLSQENAYAQAITSIMNITLELDCLHPTPDNVIVTTLTSDHKVVLLGFLPNTKADTGTSQNGFDINNFKYSTYGD